ncbi:homeobox protein 2-like isoform X2 [Ruditapes philippinarum]|uniref:homeobox protein 2-like isoform X2 n=1 Tax=Ruditapes philippinarum TaxID=129788 RepID=UPI00295B5812|nr:homeobox protein 2-like isoform X2 [Ruditapes philippinarum]
MWHELKRLFRKGRQSQTRSRSQSRSRFGDMPDVDLYDSVDIGDSPASKRNSGSSLFRRSGDFTRSPPVVFDNPAYRRSFELRPSRYNSWYDPDATDFNYSQNNANLIARKSRNSERRSVSTSRLNDKNTHAQEHRRHGSSSSWHSSIRDHVPKMLNSSSEGDFEQRSPYLYSSQNRLISNGVNNSPGLPRTPIENVGNQKRPNSKSKHSYRSRSYDPDLSTGSGSLEETQFMSINNERSRGQYMKHNQSKKNVARERKEKMSKRKDRRPTDIDIPHDRIYRNNSENRNKYSPIQYPRNSSYRGTESHILSSNLHPVSTNYNGVGDNYGRNRSRTNSDRSPDVDDYYAGQGRSFRDISSDNNRRYNNRHSSYKPDRNEIYMFQTKL